MGANDKLQAALHSGKQPAFSEIEMQISNDHPWFHEICSAMAGMSLEQYMNELGDHVYIYSSDMTKFRGVTFEAKLGSSVVWFSMQTCPTAIDFCGSRITFTCTFTTGFKPGTDRYTDGVWAEINQVPQV